MSRTERIGRFRTWLETPVGIAPLITLRVIVGAMLLFSTLRFVALGWVDDHYVCPQFHFKYFGFEWVEPLSATGMYAVHGLLILSSLCVVLGWYYRLAAVAQFLLFTYTELIDLTYYLNHYYFVSIVCGLLIFVPANRAFSLDVRRDPMLFQSQASRWTVFIFQFQLGIVYCYAGLWKINSDWLLNAMPLKIWVPANDQLPLVGWLFQQKITPWLFSWIGMLYDVSIVFWLSWSRTRPWAYLTVVVFHVLTGLMFQIGVFPLVMMGATLVFFSEKWHERLWGRFSVPLNPTRFMVCVPSQGAAPRNICSYAHGIHREVQRTGNIFRCAAPPILQFVQFLQIFRRAAARTKTKPVLRLQAVERATPSPRPPFIIHRSSFIIAFFAFQLLFPWRYLLYPGNLFWTEEGYRFSWRVMLMEKAGTATFFVKDSKTGREGEVFNGDFLNPHQEKQMAMQPDMILQYAHFLKKHYEKQGLSDPAVRAEVYVTLNARPSQLLLDPNLDLTKIRDGWSPKTWIKPFTPERCSDN